MEKEVVRLGNHFIFDISQADQKFELIRRVVIQIETPLESMDDVVLEIFERVKSFMKRGDIIALRSIVVHQGIREVAVDILRPVERVLSKENMQEK